MGPVGLCCSQCQGIEMEFNRKTAASQLRRYRKRGAGGTTRVLIDALEAMGVDGLTLLDIGGGIGIIQHELLMVGVMRATGVDASTAYLEAAREEAARQGHGDRVAFHHGDFAALAAQIAPADVVTLDRVICCYHDMGALVGLSAARARKLYGVVYPRDTWWNRMGIALVNFIMRVRRRPFRTFVYPTDAVEAVIVRNGLARQFHRQTLVWQVVVYGRSPAAQAP
ncbi:MAG: methyltransferase domain-containing protein [Armatimonadetes bacterium]|nr:methyltransferase domain-containing protein [Armatimonadota bacterium]